MKTAFSTLGCPGWSWDEIFATAKDLGLDGIEVRGVENEMFAPSIRAFNEKHLDETRARLEKAGMEIPMLTSGACLGLSGRLRPLHGRGEGLHSTWPKNSGPPMCA